MMWLLQMKISTGWPGPGVDRFCMPTCSCMSVGYDRSIEPNSSAHYATCKPWFIGASFRASDPRLRESLLECCTLPLSKALAIVGWAERASICSSILGRLAPTRDCAVHVSAVPGSSFQSRYGERADLESLQWPSVREVSAVAFLFPRSCCST
jgi:hypothetical protein